MLTPTLTDETALHRWPAGAKLGAVAALGLALGAVSDPILLLGALLAVWAAYLPLGRAETLGMPRRLWPLWPFVLVIGGWHLLRGTPETGLAITLRMLAMFAAASLMLLTTRFDDLLGTFRRLIRPLAITGLPVDRVALALAMTVRFIPVLASRAGELSLAWQARSARKPRHRLLPPLALAALDEADHAAEALRARSASV